MRNYVLTSIALLPLVFACSYAAQNAAVDSAADSWSFSSEDSGSSSYLGVDIADVTAERLSTLKLREEKGVEVTMVDQDAPAGKAGIREHDVILTMNGNSVESAAQLRRMIRETPPGRVVTFGLSRDGQPISVKVQLADRRKEFSFMAPKVVQIPEIHVPEIDIPSISMVMVTGSARSGLSVECITPQLAEFFGVKNGTGVLVRSVEKGSRADKAGFRAGDVIVKVNDQPVHDTSDFSHAVRAHHGGSYSIGVIRDKKEQILNLSIPERKDSGEIFEEESSGGESPVQADSAIEMTALRDQIAKLQPQLEMATDSYRKSTEELRKSLCDQEKKLREESQKQREQFKKQEQALRLQMERLRQDMRRKVTALRKSMDI